MPLFLMLYFSSTLSTANEIQSLSGFSIKINNSALTILRSDFTKVINGTAVNLQKPLCLSADDRSAIPSGTYNNPSPLPGIKVDECANSSSQIYEYTNNKIINAKNEKCLTRLDRINMTYVADVTSSQQICNVSGSISTNYYNTTIGLSSCSSSQDQLWDLQLNTANNKYQFKSGSNCLSLKGKSDRGTLLNNGPICTLYSNIFDMEMNTCGGDNTSLSFEKNYMILERIVPIIIPL